MYDDDGVLHITDAAAEWVEMEFEQDPDEPIILSRVGPGDGWWPDALAGVLTLQQDEDGSYIVNEEKTVIYGHGETPLEALADYIVSMIEYVQLLLPKTIKAL